MDELEIEEIGSDSSGSGNKKNHKGRKPIYLIIMVICLIAAIFAIVYIVRYFAALDKGKDTYESLQAEVVSTQPSAEPSVSEEPTPEVVLPEGDMGRIIDFQALHDGTNEDIYSWIYIPGTNVDYPVLQHPDDNAYYLNYNIDGTKGYPGCIYTEIENAKDYSDFNTIIYGHNMKNGTMFHDLHNYSDASYMEEHPYVYIYMEDRTLKYQVFAAYKYDDRHLLYAFDYASEYGREKYVEEALGQRSMSAVYDEDVEVTSESNIITMSTCIGGQASNRFLVQAVLIDEADINVS